MKRLVHILFTRIYLLFKQRKFKKRLSYVFINNHAEKLLVVFSAFTPKPTYNYMRTLSRVNSYDKLFILDDFGYRGSYYWFESGTDLPLKLTKELLGNIIGARKYSSVSTMGTSKGGTCAIFFGLEFNVDHIYSGACQYYVGNYLNTEEHEPILRGMLGDNYTNDDVEKLNRMLPSQLSSHKGSKTLIHLLYSENEHTYPEHIVHLISDLCTNSIQHTKRIEKFEDHNDVGKFFQRYILSELQIS